MVKTSKSQTVSQKLSQVVVSSRPISWVNTAFPFVAGYLFASGQINSYFFVASFYFLVPYNVLIYVINDVFDYESDVRNPRKNSIEGGLLPPQTHKFMITATIAFNSIFLVYLFMFGNLASNILLLAIVVAALSYSVPPVRLKERPFLDSINSSLHFVSPLIFALILTGWESAYWAYVIAFFLWGCASHAFGAVQDIRADREANIKSIATYLGAKKIVRLSLALYASTIVLLLLCGWPALTLCLPMMGYIAMVIPFINLSDTNAEQAHAGWQKFLILNQFTGFVVTIILILSKLK